MGFEQRYADRTRSMAMEREIYRVLLVEDDEDDHLLVQDMLSSQPRALFELDWCATYEDGLAAIREQRHDVYLIDYHLGKRTGLELVREAFPSAIAAPIILLTGQGDYEIDLEASALGVTDYLTKQALDSATLERSIRYAISHHKALRALARSEERYALAALATNDGIWDWDLKAQTLGFTPRWHAILGRTEPLQDATPDTWLDLVHDDDRAQVRTAIDTHLAGGTPHLEVEHRMRHADGHWLWVLNRGIAIRDQSGVPTRVAGSMTDITERVESTRQLQHEALHDPLTGLSNRALFIDRLEQILRRSVREPVSCAVLFIDLDRFKAVNDNLSHAVGDQLLVAVGERLVDCLRPGDTAARIGGDEFTLLLDRVSSTSEATTIAERVHSMIAKPFSVAGHELSVGASIGVALSRSTWSAAELVRNADIAMYAAKRRPGGPPQLFDEKMHSRVLERVNRERELRQAVEQSLMTVQYQPIVDLETGEIRELEALARWPTHWPQLAPSDFIPIAEETGLISRLGLDVLRTALDALSTWRRDGIAPEELRITVNLSRRQLDDPALPEQILDAIASADVPADRLRLEITESTLMLQHERVGRLVSEACRSGVGLILDDFGTGYSSLSALQQFHVSALKIDQSFISALTGELDGSESIIRSTIALAHSLGMKVIAKGIEKPAQLERLREFECELGQGFLFAGPLSPGETCTYLRNGFVPILPGRDGH